MKLTKQVNKVMESSDDDLDSDNFSERGSKFVVDGRSWKAIADWQNNKNNKGYPLIALEDNTYYPLANFMKKYNLKLEELSAVLPEQKGEQTIIVAQFKVPAGGLSLDSEDMKFFYDLQKDIHMVQFEDNSITIQLYQKPSRSELYSLN